MLLSRFFGRQQIQTIRRVRPSVEGFESRLLLSGTTAATAVISGTTSRDISGNGVSSDDTPSSGVTVELFKAGGSSPIATTVSGSNGTYSFTKLAPGSYSVQEVHPNGWVQTSGLGGYTVNLTKSGQTVSNQNFDNFDAPLYSTATISDVEFTVTSPAGKSVYHGTSLNGNVPPGDTVNVHFDLSKPEMVELVAYTSSDGETDPQSLQKQVIFSQAESWTTASGAQSATVTVPNGDFQLDFVAGPGINHVDTNTNVDYTTQGRLIESTMGGTRTNGLSTLSGTVDVTTATGQKTGLNLPGGVEIELTGTDYTGKAVKQTVDTDANGSYTFTDLLASNSSGYRITEIVPTGYVQDKATPGSTGSLGSSNNKYITTFINTNTTSTGNNFLDATSGN